MPLDKNTIQAQNGVVRYLKDNMGTLIGLLAMCVILSFTTNGVTAQPGERSASGFIECLPCFRHDVRDNHRGN